MSTSQKSKSKIFTISFFWIFMAMFLVRLTSMVQSTGMPLYVQSLGGSKSVAGLMTTCYTVTALVFRPVVGKILDRYDRKRVLIFGTALYMLISYAYGITASIPLLFVLRGVHGIGFAMQGTAASTVSTDVIPEDRMAEGIGYFGLSNSLGQALGPTIAISLINGVTYSWSFIIGGFFTTLALLCALPIKSNDRYSKKLKEADEQRADDKPAVSEHKWWHNIIDPTGVRTAIITCLVALAAASVSTFLPTRANELGIENIGTYFTVQAVAIMVARLTVGKISTKFGSNYILIPAAVLMIVTFALMAASTQFWQFLVIAVFYGLAMGMIQPELHAVMVVDAPPERRGMANSTFFLAYDLGIGVGAAMHGWIADAFAGTAIKTGSIFICASVISVVLLFAYIFLMAPQRRRKKEAK